MGLGRGHLTTFLLLIPPAYVWFACLRSWLRSHDEYKRKRLHLEKHNCVVSYSRETRGMSGWPAYDCAVKLTKDSLAIFVEPLVYFIETAEKSIDVLVMNVNLRQIFAALEAALLKGVAVRALFDGYYTKDLKAVNRLRKAGAEVCFYIHDDHDTLLHCKYAVKDYSASDKSGYAVCGSLNWTISSITENFEDLVFTTNSTIVKALHRNFEETWSYMRMHQSLYGNDSL